jgi:phosphate binding protein
VDLQASTSPRPNRLWTIALVAGTLLALALIVWDARGPRRGPTPSAAPVEAAELKGSDDRTPRLRKGTPPPPPATHLAVNPTIVCRTLVGLDGHVVEARVYQPRPELAEYERAALLAVRHFEFEPASRGGNTVQAWINWPVTFADPSQILGKVRLKGSDTIGGELAPRLGTSFRDERADLEVTVDAFGSATAFSGLFDRSADIGIASRSVNPEEVERASFLHLKLDEYVFAYDGIAVIVNPQNPIAELSLEQVSRIFSGKVKTWKEAGASKGGAIHLFSRPSYSGTHQFFLQRVVKLDRRDSPDGFAPEIEWLERTEEIVAKVSADPDAIGYGGLGWVTKGVKVLALSPSPGARAIRPNEDTIEDATYPVSRPLLMYTRGAPSANAAAFLRFVFSPRGQEVIKSAGFVPIQNNVLVIVPRDKPEVVSYDLFRILFPERGAAVDPAEEGKMNLVVEALKVQGTRVLVVGNADFGEGNAAETQQISEQRAQAAGELLKKQGVPPAVIVVKADGATHPVAGKDAPEHHQNRRVDLYVVREKK